MKEICLHLFICNAHILNVNTGMISSLLCCINFSPWLMCTFSLCASVLDTVHDSPSHLKLGHSLVSRIKLSLVYSVNWLHGTASWKHGQKHKNNKIIANKNDGKMVQSHVGCGWILYLRLLKTTSARKPHHSLSAAPSSSRRIQRLLQQKLINLIISNLLNTLFSFQLPWKGKNKQEKNDLTE